MVTVLHVPIEAHIIYAQDVPKNSSLYSRLKNFSMFNINTVLFTEEYTRNINSFSHCNMFPVISVSQYKVKGFCLL